MTAATPTATKRPDTASYFGIGSTSSKSMPDRKFAQVQIEGDRVGVTFIERSPDGGADAMKRVSFGSEDAHKMYCGYMRVREIPTAAAAGVSVTFQSSGIMGPSRSTIHIPEEKVVEFFSTVKAFISPQDGVPMRRPASTQYACSPRSFGCGSGA